MRMHFSVFLFIALSCLFHRASGQFLSDLNGKPVFETRYTHVEGSPYLHSDWLKGRVKLANGSTYSDIELKYDQVADELLFRDKNGNVLTFVDAVAEFMLPGSPPPLFRSGFHALDNHTERSFYQILYDGGIKLLKKSVKKISEVKQYNSASSTTKFDLIETYYIGRENQPVKFRKDKKSLFKVLGNKTDMLENYVKAENLNLKEEADLVKLIHYYNSIL